MSVPCGHAAGLQVLGLERDAIQTSARAEHEVALQWAAEKHAAAQEQLREQVRLLRQERLKAAREVAMLQSELEEARAVAAREAEAMREAEHAELREMTARHQAVAVEALRAQAGLQVVVGRSMGMCVLPVE